MSEQREYWLERWAYECRMDGSARPAGYRKWPLDKIICTVEKMTQQRLEWEAKQQEYRKKQEQHEDSDEPCYGWDKRPSKVSSCGGGNRVIKGTNSLS